MSRLGINTGTNPNDGQGDSLRRAMGKINSNFQEVYNVLGDGENIVSYANTSGISTLSENLTGSPIIQVSGILNTGITTTEHIEVTNITSTGIITAVSFRGDGSQLENVIATGVGLEILDNSVRKGVASELNFTDGIVAGSVYGSNRIDISLEPGFAVGSGIVIQEEGSSVGTAGTINFVGTGVTATFSSGIATVEITTTSSGSVGSAGTWAVNAAGIHTSKNVGIGTELSSSALWVEGNGYFSGVVTATRFESTSAGTPTIDSPNNLNINAINVAISTELTVGDTLTVGGAVIINSTGLSGSGIHTATSFRTNSTVGDGSDVGFAIRYYVTANGFSAYRFAGPGLLNTTDNPTFYLQRGFTYIFENSTETVHPFRIQFVGTTIGVGTYVSGSQTGTQYFTIPFDAPSSYEYQCTLHGGMLGTFNVA